MDKLADLLRQGADKLVNLPTQAQRFVTNPQAFVQLLTGKNPLPRETGFAAGATGLSPEQGTVLDPNYQAYMQGYEQGEPISIAAMAAPAAVPVAKALAPKAGQMAEQYMVNQGFMPSLIAYHGTPHTIKGKFDISKVGTGEGAQAYGHGMYFAESPAVAQTYANTTPAMGAYPSMRRSIHGVEVEAGTPEAHAATLLSRQGMTVKKAKDLVNSWINDPSAMSADQNVLQGWKKTLETLNTIKKKSDVKDIGMGNLYKVDIPDEYIPNMLDWDKPLNQQPKAIQDALAKYDPDLYSPKGMDYDPNELGQIIYSRLQSTNSGKGSMQADAAAASNILNSLGIKGIRYLDEGSRNQALQPYYQLIRKSDNSIYTQMQDLKKAEEFVKNAKKQGVDFEISAPIDKRTSNFVVFDPSEVKILEQNSKPLTRKEIIEQELEKVAK